ncbi:MAG: glycosyltransferase [Candidatus Eisenbacteria bacterium]|nr:glycosyltransferase [Candidatus Eisenbacteria bacterium]
MRILFLSSRIPHPPDRGDRVRAFHLLETFASEHEVDLLTFTEREMDRPDGKALGALCGRVEEVVLPRSRSVARAFRGLLSRDPLQVHYYKDKAFGERVRALVREDPYDLVFSHLFRVFPYARSVEGAFRLLDLTDVISREVVASAAYRRFPMNRVYRLEGARIRRFEIGACRDAHEIWVISEAEREILAREGVGEKVRVVPNGVEPALLATPLPAGGGKRIGFLGHLEVFHNVDSLSFFCERVLPRIRERVPEARLLIAGRGASPVVNDLARRDGVRFEGFVDDLAAFFARIDLFIAPLRFAAGTQNKVIQAMAAGVPVLVSPEVARGIDGSAEEAFLTASSEEDWVEKAVELLRDGGRARFLGEAGRRFVESRFTWNVARERLRTIERERGGS